MSLFSLSLSVVIKNISEVQSWKIAFNWMWNDYYYLLLIKLSINWLLWGVNRETLIPKDLLKNKFKMLKSPPTGWFSDTSQLSHKISNTERKLDNYYYKNTWKNNGATLCNLSCKLWVRTNKKNISLKIVAINLFY